MTRDTFTKLENHGLTLAACPLCGAAAELWERAGERSTNKAGMCSHDDPLGPIESGCPMFIPPEDFFRPTRREAAHAWNMFARTVALKRSGIKEEACICGEAN